MIQHQYVGQQQEHNTHTLNANELKAECETLAVRHLACTIVSLEQLVWFDKIGKSLIWSPQLQRRTHTHTLTQQAAPGMTNLADFKMSL